MLDARLNHLGSRSPILAASLIAVTTRCGRPSCHCQHSGPPHPAHQLSFKEQGKTRTVHVPKDLLSEVQLWVAEHKRLKRLLQEIHTLSVALVRTHVRHRRRQYEVCASLDPHKGPLCPQNVLERILADGSR
jgi:hypothetical protein